MPLIITGSYRKSYLVHLNSLQGICYLYKVRQDSSGCLSASLFTSINVASDCLYQLLVHDNLLYIHNMTE